MEKLQNDLLKRGKKLVFGSQRSLKLLRNDKLERVYLAKNCDEEVKEEIMKGKEKVGGVDVVELDVVNSEVGAICKKPFAISVVGLSR